MKYFETSWKKRTIQSWYRLLWVRRGRGGRLVGRSQSAWVLRAAAAAVPLQGVVTLGVNCSLLRSRDFNSVVVGLGGFLFPSPSEGFLEITNRTWGEEAQFDTFESRWGHFYRFRFRELLGGDSPPEESLSAPFIEGHRIRVSWNKCFFVWDLSMKYQTCEYTIELYYPFWFCNYIGMTDRGRFEKKLTIASMSLVWIPRLEVFL